MASERVAATYIMTLEITEGSSEFWEEVDRANARDAKKMVRDAALKCLVHNGLVNAWIGIGTVRRVSTAPPVRKTQ